MKKEGFFYGALLFAFAIPFPPKLVTMAMIIWGILSLVSFNKTQFNKNKLLWILPLIYSSYFIGFFSAQNFTLKFLEYKLSLVVFPVLFFLHTYDADKRNKILKAFVLGLLVSGICCLIAAFYNTIQIEDGQLFFQANVLKGKAFIESVSYGGNYFFSKHFSIFHQTVYYALYLSVGIAILLFQPNLFQQKKKLSLILFFVTLVFLISNKASFIVLAFILLFWMSTVKQNNIKKIIGFAAIGLAISALLVLNPRAKGSIQNVIDGNLNINKNARYGFGTRLLSWNAALSLIKEKPLAGHGYADAQAKLNETYASKEYAEPLKQSFNTHNLWLQIWIENGIISVGLLVVVFSTLLFSAVGQKNYLTLVISATLILLINSMFESLFSRFSGISFFAFLFCFLITHAEFSVKNKNVK